MKPTSRNQLQKEIDQMDFDSESFDNLYSIATRSILKHDYCGCLDILNRIILIHGESAQLLLNRSICQIRLKEYSDALESLERILELDPEFTEALKLKSIVGERVDRQSKYWGVQMYQ